MQTEEEKIQSARKSTALYNQKMKRDGHPKVCVRPHRNDRERVIRYVQDLNALRKELEESS